MRKHAPHLTREQQLRQRLLRQASARLAPRGFRPIIMEEQWPLERRHRKNLNSKTRQKVKARMPICVWCRAAPTTTVDHVWPLARGGSNSLYNLVGSCEPCNTAKANFLPRELGWSLRITLDMYPKVA